jgi:UDP-glucose 4-epimerase|tara:strand:+ start:2482 stop:3369 length:888 start_codon:yes stop_codon:yes gene_type:complete
MKVGVFGGAGFLGSYLVETLVSKGHETICMDLRHGEDYGAKFIKIDILDKDAVSKICEKEKFDAVYNLAGFANLDKAIQNPTSTIELNIIGNLNILEACRVNKVSHYLYASSAYAVSSKGSFYGISKLASEKIIKEYGLRYGMNFTILRYGSVYSERDFENNYIFNLVREAMETGKIVHHGDGEEQREYIHAMDAAALSVDVLNKKDFFGKHIILTGADRFRRIDLFRMIAEISNIPIEISLQDDGYANHYKHTPYAFAPEVSQRLVPNPFIDMGQGILSCFNQVHIQQSNNLDK